MNDPSAFSLPSAPVVITGAGLITCLGPDRQTNWRNVAAGKCGMRPFTVLESPLPPDKLGGQAVDLPDDGAPADLPREVRYLRRAIRDALAEAGIGRDLPYDPRRCGWMIGTTLHGMRAGGHYLRTGDHGVLRRFLAGSTLHAAVEDLALDGLAATTCSACSSSLGSIALGVTLLRSGELDLVIAGGYDTISEYAYGGFNSLRLVTPGALRPFTRGRQGMKLAEGYGIVVMERWDDAHGRGAKALVTVLGYGESADAHHLTQPHPQGEGAARAMTMALQSAGVQPADIGLIAAHATGTPDNDAGEYAAMSRVFGERLASIPVVGFKSHLGHTLGGAGAVELILSAEALRAQVAPPTANVMPDEIEFPGLCLLSGAAQPAAIRATLNTSLGFGGANTCVVLGQPPLPSCDTGVPPVQVSLEQQQCGPARSASRPHGRDAHVTREVLITGIGVVLPGIIGGDALVARLAGGGDPCFARDTGAILEGDLASLFNARRVRRVSDYAKLTLAATALATADAAITDVAAFARDCSVILGTAHGSASYCDQYYRQIIAEGLIGANPMLFAEGVPNAAAAHLSLMLSLKGACQTIIGSRTAALDALRLAARRIGGGEWDRAIVGAAEEYSDIINAAYGHCGLYAGRDASPPFGDGRGFVSGAAAVTFVLESRQAFDRRTGGAGKARGRFDAGAAVVSAQRRGREAGRQLLDELGRPAAVLSSANGTWLDRVEAAVLSAGGDALTVSALYGHVAESFGAGPLVAAAAVLLAGRLPRLFGGGSGFGLACRAATGEEAVDSFAVVATDYTGLLSAMRLSRC